ncbi:MAG: NAD(P)-dependent oxidoreductase [Candidatus Riflebacteria bacterium]|nr:NAD(P)-dependent oxidoreductase [Candidatus Riflebacteria bacterium]
MSRKNMIVFGATGTLGLYLMEYLKEHLNSNEWRVIAVGRRNTSFFSRYSPLVEYCRADISKKEMLDSLPQSNVHSVLHFAGALPGYMEGYHPQLYIDSNVTGTLNVLDYCRKSGADRVLFTQTISDYYGYYGKLTRFYDDMPRAISFTGDHSFYAISKCMAEDMCWHYQASYGLKSFVFRLPNIYCYMPDIKTLYVDGKPAPSSYRYMIGLAMEGKPIELWGDPKKGIDIIYVKDFCQMMLKACFVDRREGGRYNVGTGKMISLEDQIKGMIQVFSPKDKQSIIIPRPEKRDCVNFCMDIEKARKDLGYEPKYDYISYLEDYKKEMEADRFNDFFTKP